MVIQRDQYISELISKQWNGKVKIVTGIRRCGKSFLLFTLYKNYLLNEGVAKDCFVELALDKKAHVKYRNPNELYEYVLRKTQNTEKRYYVFIDEIQLEAIWTYTSPARTPRCFRKTLSLISETADRR